MRVFVTGASGFVGGHVVEELKGEHELLAMARSERSAKVVEGYGAKPVTCSLGAVEVSHLEGVDVVVHSAAFVEEWGTHEQFWQSNVEGTTQLLEVAKKAGVSRFIHIGTEAACFDGHDLIDIDESYPFPTRQKFLYSETKAEAERRVLAANEEGFTTLSLRPRFVWGPRDTSVLPAVLTMAKEGRWSWLDGGRHQTSTTHVKNLTHAVSLAMTAGRGGEAYFIADAEQSSLREFLTELAASRGVSLPNRSIPGALARPLAGLIEGIWRLFRIKKTPPMTSFAISMMSRSVTVRTVKAKKELGYTPVLSVAEGMAQLQAL